MTIPIPPYSAFRDIWNAVSTRLRERRLTSEVFRGWTVDEWYDLYEAIRHFADRYLLELGDRAHREADEAWAELPPGVMFPEGYESQRALAKSRDELLREDLRVQLVDGKIIARGFREPFSHGAPYLTISRHEWRVIKLELPDRAEGGGIGYVGLTIGKPGTKRLFRRGR